MSEFRQHFFSDSIDRLNVLRARIGESADSASIRELARLFHTIKGGGRMFSMPSASSFAAHAEEMFHGRPSPGECVETIDRMISILRGDEIFDAAHRDVNERAEIAFADIPREVFLELEPSERAAVFDALVNSRTILGGKLSFYPENFAADFAALRNGVLAAGELIAMIPCAGDASRRNFFVLFEFDSSDAIPTNWGEILPVSGSRDNARTLDSLFKSVVSEIGFLSDSLGKVVETRIFSNPFEPDDRLRAGLATILIHLARNAVDHGIGESGCVDILLFRESDAIRLMVADNGRGFNLDEISRRLADFDDIPEHFDDVFDMIATAGFSTANKVTEISGRGIGLDAVRAEIIALNGKISARNRKPNGVAFEIEIPAGASEAAT